MLAKLIELIVLTRPPFLSPTNLITRIMLSKTKFTVENSINTNLITFAGTQDGE